MDKPPKQTPQKKETWPEKFSRERREIEEMSQEDADKYAAKDFHHLIVTMPPDDFLFLLERISTDAWRNIFMSLTEGEVSLMHDKVGNNPKNPLLEKRLEALMDKIKPKGKHITQEIILEHEQLIEKAEKLVAEIKKLGGYSVTPSVLEKRNPYDKKGRIPEIKEIKEIIYDLEKLKKIIGEVREFIHTLTIPAGVGGHFMFQEGGYTIVPEKEDVEFLDKSTDPSWPFEFLMVTKEFREYLQNKPKERSKKAKTQPMKTTK